MESVQADPLYISILNHLSADLLPGHKDQTFGLGLSVPPHLPTLNHRYLKKKVTSSMSITCLIAGGPLGTFFFILYSAYLVLTIHYHYTPHKQRFFCSAYIRTLPIIAGGASFQ